MGSEGMSKERRAEIEQFLGAGFFARFGGPLVDAAIDLLAELRRVEAERDEWRTLARSLSDAPTRKKGQPTRPKADRSLALVRRVAGMSDEVWPTSSPAQLVTDARAILNEKEAHDAR
jgi:hypothetical protein